MKIVVTGASGFIGRQLIPILLEAGHSVLIVSRDSRRTRSFFPECHVVAPDEWWSFSVGYDCLLHLAAMNSDSKNDLAAYLEVNDKLAAKYAEDAKRAAITRFIYASSVHTLYPKKQSNYSASKKKGEESVIRAFGPAVTVMYLGAVHGSHFPKKLSFLDWIAPSLGKVLFSLASTLQPTTSVSLIAELVEDETSVGQLTRRILTDPKGQNICYRGWQGLLNVAFLTGSILVLPLIFVWWVTVLITDGKPGLFSQERVGKDSASFVCLKLRTMRKNTPSVGTHDLEDKYFLPGARLIRSVNLDEFPQAVNILRRQMNLIGPRPSLPSQFEIVDLRQKAGVLELLPGLTGWAQVNAADMSSPRAVAKFDEQYLHLRSVSLDVEVLLKTLKRR
jgi:lipopolysaccharide/colanic/teichoic acid biosynthesis glycosyltransferase